MIIVISGLPRTDTTSVGKNLALQFGLSYLSEKGLMKKANVSLDNADEKAIERIGNVVAAEAEKQGVIIDYIASAWLLNNADAKVFIKSDKKNRALGIVRREKIPLAEAVEQLSIEEEASEKAMLKFFGFDIHDLSVYDLVVNADSIGTEGTIAVIKKFIEKRMSP